ncbi:hypothetical protein ARALYDRAFT_480940 [Arabidopsis lyrata subsp. lyrata]|uniref:Uncharacterized protein n=1 Tax=Arabidopsis lyrata subsp. lyrata TaxID=81972 RepID=D7L5C3_ARALL|nr:hypothetical protein ARALYDRAFT_480940 [Arabidopsis lyrata subsp. lyrata]
MECIGRMDESDWMDRPIVGRIGSDRPIVGRIRQTDRRTDQIDRSRIREKCSKKHEDKCNRTHPRVAHGCNLTGKGSKYREWVSDVVHHESVTPMVTRRITNGKVHAEGVMTTMDRTGKRLVDRGRS